VSCATPAKNTARRTYSRCCLKKIGPDGRLIGIDRDKAAILNAEKIFGPYKDNVDLFHTEFSRLPFVLDSLGILKVDGILADLGISLYQIEASGRGFSFMRDEPLDMRMNPEEGKNAEDLINGLSEKNLAKIFREYGEERRSKKIAKEIARARAKKRIKTSRQLADIILKARPVWINSYDHEDLLAFKMGVEFIEEPSRKVMSILKKAMKEQLASF